VEVGGGEVERGGEGVGDGDAAEAGGLGGADAVGGVLEGDGLGRRHAGGVEDGVVKGGVGLHAGDVVRGADDVEVREQAQPLEVAADPGAIRRGGDGQPDAQAPGGVHVLPHAGKRLLAGDQLGHARRAAGTHCGGVDGPLQQRLEVTTRIERVVGADVRGPQAGVERAAVLRVDLAPGIEGGLLGVEDQAVEVEDEKPRHVRSSGRAPSRW
jgi:hypothetical protein